MEKKKQKEPTEGPREHEKTAVDAIQRICSDNEMFVCMRLSLRHQKCAMFVHTHLQEQACSVIEMILSGSMKWETWQKGQHA